MSTNALRYRKPLRPKPAKQKRTKPPMTAERIEHAHNVLQRMLKHQKPINGQNPKDAAWHVSLNGDDQRKLGRSRQHQVALLIQALWELKEAGVIKHDGSGYRLAGQMAA